MDEWENLCLQCGACCYEKIEGDGGAVFFTATPCQHLDTETGLCRIYDRRFELNPDCIKLTEKLVRKLSWLHDECGYRAALGVRRNERGGKRGKGKGTDSG